MDDAQALLAFTRGLAEAATYEQLERAFALGFPRVVDVPMAGFSALDRENGGIAHNVAVNVSGVFVARYVRAWSATRCSWKRARPGGPSTTAR
jgi:hypothetical protein